MTKWDTRMLDLVTLVASWSKDPSTQVGAAIVDQQNRVVSLGFNGFPHGVADIAYSRAEKLNRTIHAEENAILFANRSVSGCTLYVTHHPCARCAAKLIQVGIRRVVIRTDGKPLSDAWRDEIHSAAEMFDEVGVEVVG